MTGVMWRKLLGRIGPAIRSSTGVFPDELKDRIASLYENFKDLLDLAGKCTTEAAEEVAARANCWVQSYLDMGKLGYSGFRMVPYLHMIVTHLPHSVKLFGGFEGKFWVLRHNFGEKKPASALQWETQN